MKESLRSEKCLIVTGRFLKNHKRGDQSFLVKMGRLSIERGLVLLFPNDVWIVKQ